MLFRFIAPHKTLSEIFNALVDHICQRCHEYIRLLPRNASVLEPLYKRIGVKMRTAPQQQGRGLSQGHTHPRHSRPQPHVVVRDPRGVWGTEQGDMIKWRCVCNYLYGGREGGYHGALEASGRMRCGSSWWRHTSMLFFSERICTRGSDTITRRQVVDVRASMHAKNVGVRSSNDWS